MGSGNCDETIQLWLCPTLMHLNKAHLSIKHSFNVGLNVEGKRLFLLGVELGCCHSSCPPLFSSRDNCPGHEVLLQLLQDHSPDQR